MVTKIFKSGNSLALRLPKALAPKEGRVRIHREGERLIVEPLREGQWPEDFFERIRIDMPFERPPQDETREIIL